MIALADAATDIGKLIPDFVMTAAVLLVANWFHRALGRQQDTFATALTKQQEAFNAALQAAQMARDTDREAFREEIHRLVDAHERTTGAVVEQLGVRLDRLSDTQRELAEAVARLSAQHPAN